MKLKNQFGISLCVSGKPLNIAPSIIIFVEQWQQTKNTTTVVGFMTPQHHLLQNQQTLYNAGKSFSRTCRQKIKKMSRAKF